MHSIVTEISQYPGTIAYLKMLTKITSLKIIISNFKCTHSILHMTETKKNEKTGPTQYPAIPAV